MPFALLIIGTVLLVAGVRNSQDVLFSTVKGDFTGSNNFLYWFVAIILIGSIGYVPKLKPISTGFLTLVIVSLFLSKGGFFQQFSTAISSTSAGSLLQAPSSSAPANTAAQTAAQNLQNLENQLAPYLTQSQAGVPFGASQ